MQANKKILSFLILSALTLLLAGCPGLQKSGDDTLSPDSAIPQQNSSTSKRFQDVTPGGQTVVDSAITLAKKYAEISEEKTVLQQKNQELVAENGRLKNRITVLEPELEQAKKHLSDADDLLIEMRIELNNWQTDILGYRDEIRESLTVQGKLLLKMAEVLGAEIEPELSRKLHQGLTTVSPNKQSRPESKETNISGEPNE